MKKIFTLLALSVCGFSFAQTYLDKNFDDDVLTSGGWTTQLVIGTLNWDTYTFGGEIFARMSNYNGTNNASETWLISPAMDLSTAITPTLTFISACNFTGAALELMISTNYDGTSAPGTATWTSLTATWSPGTYTWTSSGNVDLSAYIASGVYIAYKYTGSASDGKTWEVDDILVNETGVVPPSTISIYDIQYTTAGSGDSPEVGNDVTTIGVVTGVIGFGADVDRFFIQDGDGPWNGIYIYENGTPVTLGDSVEVSGTVTEYFGLTEITNVTNITIISSGNPQPNPVQVSTLAAAEEQYETVLVQVTDAICNNADAGFGQYIVNDGTGDRLIDDQIYSFTPTLGNAYNITGVTFLSFSEVKIYPRISSDITTVGFASVTENNDFTIFPNPAAGTLYMQVAADAIVRIYSMTGAMVFEGTVQNSVDISGFEPGIYQVTVTNGTSVSTQKLVVR